MAGDGGYLPGSTAGGLALDVMPCPVTILVANTHLMDETTPEIVRAGIRSARDLEAATGIPVRFCAMQRGLAEAFGGPDGAADHLPILAMERHIVAPFAPTPRGVRRSSTVV